MVLSLGMQVLVEPNELELECWTVAVYFQLDGADGVM